MEYVHREKKKLLYYMNNSLAPQSAEMQDRMLDVEIKHIKLPVSLP